MRVLRNKHNGDIIALGWVGYDSAVLLLNLSTFLHKLGFEFLEDSTQLETTSISNETKNYQNYLSYNVYKNIIVTSDKEDKG